MPSLSRRPECGACWSSACRPKFVRKYVDLTEVLDGAFRQYIEDVKSKDFPQPEHCYKMSKEEFEKLGIDVD